PALRPVEQPPADAAPAQEVKA
ncbi:MAG: hypothetical protein QOI63_866, partial [Thermoplasmata archaeon]|nr:hypothetical protein [Thermoplasmata archaeon]